MAVSSWLVPGDSKAASEPSSTSAPAISGSNQVGQTLTESHAKWSFTPYWYGYQWEQCDAAGQNCKAITGATGQTYVAASNDVGHTLRVEETAVGWTGRSQATGQAFSAATAVVTTPPVASSAPTTTAPAPRNSTTTTALLIVDSSAVTDQNVTLIATVTSSSAASPPSGTLTFESHGTPIAGCQNEPIQPTGQSVTVSCQTSFAASVAQLTAVFTPSSGSVISGSVSAPDAFTVQPDSTTTSVDVSRHTVRVHGSVTYTATVQPSNAGPVEPSATVAFLDNAQPVSACASRPIVWTGTGGTATCTVTFTGPGQHLITAHYGGDGSFSSSTSSVPQLVDALAGRIHPFLSWSFYYAPSYTKVLVLKVNHAPRGAQVHVTCDGRGCPVAARTVSLRRGSSAVNLVPLFGTHRLKPGTVIAVTVQRPGWIGKRYSFKVQAAHPPRLWITCQAPGLPAGVGC